MDTENLITTSKKISAAYKRTLLAKGDVVIALRGKIGELAVISEELVGANLTRGVALLAPLDGYDSSYLCYYLSSRRGKQVFERNLNGSALQEIPIATLRKIPVVIPPLPEQRAISAALGEMDALIGALEQLIGKKRDLKRAAMQQLFTGKKRLVGFGGNWKTRPLGELIAHCSSGATPYRGHPEYYRGAVKWITSGELNFSLITDTVEHISKEAVEKTNLKIHLVGTFLMAITGLEAAGTRGACGIVGSLATTNQSCMAIYPTSDLTTGYLYHYYVYSGDKLALRYCQGTKQQSYTAKLVKILPIEMPPSVKEQTAIATILSDMDAEIAALEARRDKTRALKQGMMQELLTGKTRLV